jgi:hypothetical protein
MAGLVPSSRGCASNGLMVRDARRCRAPHHEGLADLILRSGVFAASRRMKPPHLQMLQICVRILAARCARAVHASSPHKTEGVGNAGCPLHPQPRAQSVVKHTSVVTTSPPDSPGIPARNGFNGFLRALPGDRACLSPSSNEYGFVCPVGPTWPPLDLTPASRRQDHTTSPSAATSLVSAPLIAHRPFDPPCHHVARLGAAASTASRPASVTIAIRPSVGWDGESSRSDLGQAGTKIFLKMGLDSRPTEQPVGQISRPVRRSSKSEGGRRKA